MHSRGYIWVRCALRPVVSQPPDCQPAGILVPLLLDASRHHAGDRATSCSAIDRGGLLSSHEERAAFTAHTKYP